MVRVAEHLLKEKLRPSDIFDASAFEERARRS